MLASGQVIHAVATRITGLASGARVATSRAWPWSAADLPAWRVVEGDENVTQITVHRPALQQHELEVELRGSVKANAALDDAMREITAEALAALFDLTPPADALAAINPSKVQLSLRRIQREALEEGQADVGLVVITLRADFRTRADAPETLV